MNAQKLRPILELIMLSAFTFLCHWFAFSFFDAVDTRYFRYSLPQLYGFFFVFSLLIIGILIKVKQKNLDSVGNAFMALTCVKMVLAYLLLHPILDARHAQVSAEKTNFFITFALFLTIETVIAIRMLNRNG